MTIPLACGGNVVTENGGAPTVSSSSSTSAGISSGATSSGSTSSSTSSGISSSSSSGASSSGASSSGTFPCSPKGTCQVADDNCLGLVNNLGLTKFGLRMSELDMTSPMALTAGIVKSVIGGAVGLNLPACNLTGTGTFSWLLQFDTVGQTLKTGGARPVADPTQGYSFDSEQIVQGTNTFVIQPVTYPGVVPDASGKFATPTGQDLVMPIFLDAAGSNAVLLPLHQTILSGRLSSNNDCVGAYNAAGLDPANSCEPDGTHPQFVDAASLAGYMTLQEADSVTVNALNETLCVLLSGNATMYGTVNAGGVTVCKRDESNKIVYQGHWCSVTNMAATATCSDAEQFVASFAASSITILN